MKNAKLLTWDIVKEQYSLRLRLGLTVMKIKRGKGDFIQIYKLVYCIDRVNKYDENKLLSPNGRYHTDTNQKKTFIRALLRA